MEVHEGNPKEHRKESIWDILRFALIALVIVVPIRIFVAQPFIVSGSSMVPTFQNGEYLIVDELSYRIKDPIRGDVIIFKYPNDETKYFIKRIIGLPGETIKIHKDQITIINDANPEGFVLVEPYIKEAMRNQTPLTRTLNDSEYFVMGDNRSASSDSRTWGNLPEDNIVGKTFLRLFPLKAISVAPGIYNDYLIQ